MRQSLAAKKSVLDTMVSFQAVDHFPPFFCVVETPARYTVVVIVDCIFDSQILNHLSMCCTKNKVDNSNDDLLWASSKMSYCFSE